MGQVTNNNKTITKHISISPHACAHGTFPGTLSCSMHALQLVIIIRSFSLWVCMRKITFFSTTLFLTKVVVPAQVPRSIVSVLSLLLAFIRSPVVHFSSAHSVQVSVVHGPFLFPIPKEFSIQGGGPRSLSISALCDFVVSSSVFLVN